MDGPTDRSKKSKAKRDSGRGEEGKSADPPKVKLEERPDSGKQEMPKRHVEEGAPGETRRETTAAAPQKEAVVDKAACPGTRTEPHDSSSDDDSSSDRSDPSVTPSSVRTRSLVTGSRYRNLSNDDGEQAGGGSVTDRKRRARSRRGGHGNDGRPREARRSECRSGAFAKPRPGRRAERRAAPGGDGKSMFRHGARNTLNSLLKSSQNFPESNRVAQGFTNSCQSGKKDLERVENRRRTAVSDR